MEDASVDLFRQFDELKEDFEDNGDPDTLDRAILLVQQLVDLHPPGDPDRATYLSELADVLKDRAERGNLEDLQQAIASAQEAVDITPPGSEYLWDRLEDLAILLRTRFTSCKDEDDLNLAISLMKQSVDLMSPDDSEYRFGSLQEFAETLIQKFEVSNDSTYLDWAITIWGKCVEVADEDDPDLPVALTNFAHALEDRFDLNRDLDDIERAILFRKRAVELTHSGEKRLPSRLASLGFSLRTRYQHSQPHKEDDINTAITTLIKALELVSSEDRETRSTILSHLGMSMRTRFHFVGSESDLDDALLYLEEAVSSSPDNLTRALYLCNLGTTLHTKFLHSPSRDIMNQAISRLEEAINLESGNARLLTNLGVLYRLRFERFRTASDIDNAIHCLTQAEELTREDPQERVHCLSSLGTALLARVERAGTLEDAIDAVNALTEAVDYESKDTSSMLAANFPSQELRAEMGVYANSLGDLSNLGIAHQFLFELRGDGADLARSVEIFEQVLQRAPGDHHNRHAYLSNLAIALCETFDMTSRLPVLDRAISSLESALEFTKTGHIDRPSYLSNLGNCLQTRFEHLHSMPDLDRAVILLEECVNLTPAGHIDEAMYRGTLGLVLYTRFKWLEQTPDLTRAISDFEKAVDLSIEEDPDRFAYLSNLGIALRLKFDYDDVHLRSLSDLDRAVSVLEQAVNLIGEGHAYAPACLISLGNAVRVRSQHGMSQDNDINRAVTTLTRAVDISSVASPQRPRALSGLGLSLRDRALRSKSEGDIEQALRCFREATSSTIWSNVDRYATALQWATFARKQSRLTSALEGYRVAIRILPLLAWRGIDATSKFEAIKRHSRTIACDAASCAIELNRLEDAVELLDHGRSVFWSQLSETRTDFNGLRAVAPKLAEELEQVGSDLEYATLEDSDALDARFVSLKRHHTPVSVKRPILHRLAERWDDLLLEIRTLPGLESFLLPTPFAKLKQVATHGIIVIINVSKFRLDALVLTSAGIHVVSLEELDYYDVKDMAADFLRQLQQLAWQRLTADSFNNRVLVPVLRKIWKTVGLPLVTHLQDRAYLSISPPRVWWYLTGPLTFLPVHAAGPYKSTGSSGLADLIISSYTSTLSTLLHAYESSATDATTEINLLVVSQPNAAGEEPLPGASMEKEVIQNVIPPHIPVKYLDDADGTVKNVLQALPHCTWLHLACHGVHDAAHPMNSSFALHDNHLRLSDIAQARLLHADFAFLTACKAATGSSDLPDESLHLTSGLQFAGFKSLISTLWSVSDEDGPALTEEIYAHLFRDGRPDIRNAASVLNSSIKSMRERKVAVHRWVPFIHLGI